MLSRKFVSKSEKDTRALAGNLSRRLKGGAIICLYGDLGSGKTTFVKGPADGLKVDPRRVHSPTFVLMNPYEGKFSLYHFDLYRLEDPREILNLGYEEFFYGKGVSVVEWAEKLGGLQPEECLGVHLKHAGEKRREIVMEARGKVYQDILRKVRIP